MAASGQVKYSERRCRYGAMGLDSFLYQRTNVNGREEYVHILTALETIRRERYIEESNRRNRAGFMANDSVKSMASIKHPKSGRGKYVGLSGGSMLIEFPGYGVKTLPFMAS